MLWYSRWPTGKNPAVLKDPFCETTLQFVHPPGSHLQVRQTLNLRVDPLGFPPPPLPMPKMHPPPWLPDPPGKNPASLNQPSVSANRHVISWCRRAAASEESLASLSEEERAELLKSLGADFRRSPRAYFEEPAEAALEPGCCTVRSCISSAPASCMPFSPVLLAPRAPPALLPALVLRPAFLADSLAAGVWHVHPWTSSRKESPLSPGWRPLIILLPVRCGLEHINQFLLVRMANKLLRGINWQFIGKLPCGVGCEREYLALSEDDRKTYDWSIHCHKFRTNTCRREIPAHWDCLFKFTGSA
ncbi:hypothetical protein PAPYR_11735 [Paratrimastix pyriformis]|uniref:Uncharacterized protein n=1 Tax=Paratrimastix pyriformis TaxID=342808 RepID=A0ABQ8U8P0_9EUKA|nr:hypothetical protein PAPYR_11735 [Paratrimastix pyriformis]